VIVTIDGPAGTGKSTVARRLAKRLGLHVLDTGAMYRALTLLVLEAEVDPRDGAQVERAASNADLRFDFTVDPPRLYARGIALGEAIRSPRVTSQVSIVASHGSIRAAMVAAQRAIAAEHPHIVTEGRDQGSVVFPDADVKFYLDASVEVRARRRLAELLASERALRDAADLADDARLRGVMEDIENRDRSDRERAIGPLRTPEDAIVIDTGDRSIDEVVETLAVAAECRCVARARGAVGEDARVQVRERVFDAETTPDAQRAFAGGTA
jgi:CMP/dCMP kinase